MYQQLPRPGIMSNYAVGLLGRRAVVYDSFNGSGSVVRPPIGFGIWGVNATWTLAGGAVSCTVNAGAPTNNNFLWAETRLASGYIVSGRMNPNGTDGDKGFGLCFNVQDQFNNYRVTVHGTDELGFQFARLRVRYLNNVEADEDIITYVTYQPGDILSAVVNSSNFVLLRNGVANSDPITKPNVNLNAFTRAGLSSNFDLVSTCSEFSVETL